MNISGLELLDVRGLYFEDGWCAREVAGRARSERLGTALNVTVWVPRPSVVRAEAIFTVAMRGVDSEVFDVPFEQLSVLSLPGNLVPGREFEFSISCDALAVAPEDKREISFSLNALAVDVGRRWD